MQPSRRQCPPARDPQRGAVLLEKILETFLIDVTRGGRGGASVLRWGEARDAAKGPALHRAALTAKGYPAQAASSAEARSLVAPVLL